jgi:hypothetical protein
VAHAEKGQRKKRGKRSSVFWFRHSYIPRRTGRKKKDVASSSNDIGRRFLVGAGGLDVAGLLALVANTLTTGLSGGAVAGDVANLTTYKRREEVSLCLDSGAIEKCRSHGSSKDRKRYRRSHPRSEKQRVYEQL